MQTCGAHSRAKGVISGSATLSMVLRNALLKILMKDLSGKELIEALQHDRNAPSRCNENHRKTVSPTRNQPDPHQEVEQALYAFQFAEAATNARIRIGVKDQKK